MSKTITGKKVEITLSIGKTVTLEKMNLRRIINTIDAFGKLPEQLDKTQISNDQFMQELPIMIVDAFPKYAKLVSEVLQDQITPEEVAELEFEDALTLVEEFIEVNRIPEVIARVKKLRARVSGKK